jgi:antibiotic biosynthesis monooxygenase (ABM) superfamily enzyme
VKRKVNTKINELQRQFPDAKEEYLATKEDIKALGVTAQTTYLYIQGHHLFDTVVSPIMSKVCNLLRQERQNEIYYAVAHKTQKRNEMTCYENSLQDIKVMLKKNNGYMASEPFRRLQEDVMMYLDSSV